MKSGYSPMYLYVVDDVDDEILSQQLVSLTIP